MDRKVIMTRAWRFMAGKLGTAWTGACQKGKGDRGMLILVIDGQGGGVGRSLIEEIGKKCPEAEVVAAGTNAMATANMMKGGVSGATGENAVVFNSARADVIVGPVGIVMANAMLGEITPRMAEAVSSSRARIILIPMNRCHAVVVGVQNKRLSDYIEEAAELIAGK